MKFFRKNEISNNIIALIFVQFANYISPLLVLPYISRVLGLDGFGIVAMAMSLCSIALIVTDYGFGLSAPYWLAKNKSDKGKVAEYLGAVFFIKGMLFLVCFFVTVFLYFHTNLIPRNDTFLYALIASMFFQAFQPNWFFLGIEKMKNVTVLMVSAKLSYLFLIFLFVKKSTQVDVVMICFAISNCLAAFIGVLFIYRENYTIAKSTAKQSWMVFKDGCIFFISRLAVGVYTSASTFLVGSFNGASSAALYNSAEKLYQAGQSATSPISQALFPYLARTGKKEILYKLVGGLLIPMFFGVVFCIYYSDLIITLVFGEQFSAASELLEIFLVTLLINFIGVNFGYPAYASIGRLDIANKSVILAAVLQISSITIMYIAKCLNAKNICLSILFVETVVMLVRVFCFFYLSRKRY